MKNIYNLPTVTIGIPALNEGKNIGFLIQSLLSQVQHEFVLQTILVVSDGSTDNTVHIVRSFADPKICVIEGHERKGKAIRQNEMISHCESDILVFLDADIKIESDCFLFNLVQPILQNRADFTSGYIRPVKPRGSIDGALAHIMRVKGYLYSQINDGDCIYCCFGPARAFSRKAYSFLQFGKTVSEDAYSYLQMKANGMRFAFVRNAEFFVRVPATIADHQKQSIRFLKSGNEMKHTFTKEAVNSAYKIPLPLVFKAIMYSFLTSPYYSVVYVLLFIYMKLQALYTSRPAYLWETPQTSKSL